VMFSIEGPDRCGKSTLIQELRRIYADTAIYVPSIPVARELIPYMGYVEERQLQLWEALCDLYRTYITDRNIFVSSYVYGRMHNRKTLLRTPLADRMRCFYIDVNVELLHHRDPTVPLRTLAAVKNLYADAFHYYSIPCTVLDGTKPARTLAMEVNAVISEAVRCEKRG
jgi:thymidylate kinase